jgi:Domain of unknown function (DUF4956)
MLDWLNTALSSNSEATASAVGFRIGAAMLLGVAVAVIYRWARRGESVPGTFLTTLVLLSGLIAMATQIIGDNVARAFSLVGALSVVRFRTVVKDTQDTAFVILAVVAGMSAGASHLKVGFVGLAVIAACSVVLWPPGRLDAWRRSDSTLTLRIGQSDGTQSAVESLLASATSRFELFGAETAKKGASLDLVYHLRLAQGESPTGLIAGLTLLAGVESVGLNRRE